MSWPLVWILGCELGRGSSRRPACKSEGKTRAHLSPFCIACFWRRGFCSSNITQDSARGVYSFDESLPKQLGKQLVIILASFPRSTADVQEQGGNGVGVFWAFAVAASPSAASAPTWRSLLARLHPRERPQTEGSATGTTQLARVPSLYQNEVMDGQGEALLAQIIHKFCKSWLLTSESGRGRQLKAATGWS